MYNDQESHSDQYSIYRAPCYNFTNYGKCAYHLSLNPYLEDSAAIEIIDQVKTLSDLDLVVALSNNDKCPIEEILQHKNFIKLLIDGLNLMKKNLLIEVSGAYYYGFLEKNNIIWDISPIKREKEYRVKQHRNLIVNKYVLNGLKMQFRFDSLTAKDDERIDSFFKELPEKSIKGIRDRYIAVIIKSNDVNRTNLFISNKKNTLWKIQSQIQIIPPTL